MLHDDAIQRLGAAGLSEKEARVYVALLALGASGVQDIAAKAEVPRASAYSVLDALLARGLVRSFEEAGRMTYTAESPKMLAASVAQQAQALQQKHAELAAFVPELEALFRTQQYKPVVRFYEGEEGLRRFRDYLGQRVSQRTDAFIRLDKQLGAAAAHDAERRMKLIRPDQRMRLLYVADAGVPLPSFPPHARPPLHEIRFAAQVPFSFEGELGVHDDMAYLSTITPRVMACLIESVSMARLLRALFELSWQTASLTRE